MRVKTIEPRAENDFYPTPADVSAVIGMYLAEHNREPGLWLDPAAGDGALIREVRNYVGGVWYGIEIDEQRAAKLGCDCADALTYLWPGCNVVANPPFSLLDAFWTKIAEHRAKHKVWCAVLTPAQWWHGQRRAKYVKPDVLIALGWRAKFMVRDGKPIGGMQDHVWSILAPEPTGRTEWIREERPVLEGAA